MTANTGLTVYTNGVSNNYEKPNCICIHYNTTLLSRYSMFVLSHLAMMPLDEGLRWQRCKLLQYLHLMIRLYNMSPSELNNPSRWNTCPRQNSTTLVGGNMSPSELNHPSRWNTCPPPNSTTLVGGKHAPVRTQQP